MLNIKGVGQGVNAPVQIPGQVINHYGRKTTEELRRGYPRRA